ncbi:GumC family protein [Loktanella sp. DJP18]|uniref:GumC family protein n=1 Tax=Loktanella sp. DJP18 TaxID=3409788 RepID=UPI003BB49BDE
MTDLRFYLAIFWRRLPYFLLLLTTGTALGVTVAIISPAIYEAQARLVVESEQIPDEMASSTVRTDATEQLQIIEQRILTRDTLLEMANRLGIYQGAGTPDTPMTPDDIVTDMRQRIDIVTQGGSAIRGQTQATIVSVSFSGPTPALAANVANDVVQLMLQENVSMRTGVSGQTLDFFTQQVNQLEQDLTQLNGQLLQFQEANQDALPESLEFRRTQQSAAQERLLEQQRDENALRDRRDRLVALYEQNGNIEPLTQPQAMTPEAQRLRELQDQYATSVAVLSLDNPRVAVLRRQIDALEQTVAADGALNNPDGQPMTAYELQLADIDGQLEFITGQKEQIQAVLDALDASIAATPANAVTLGTLQRNYDNLRTRYDQAVANKAQAETGDVIESLSKGQRITVLEQAVPPSEPTSPNRKKLAAMGFASGLGMGFGFIILLELLNTAIRRPADLIGGLDITPLVTVPYLRTRQQIWRRWLIVLGVCLVLLLAVPAVLWYVDTYVRPLEPLLEAVQRRLGL